MLTFFREKKTRYRTIIAHGVGNSNLKYCNKKYFCLDLFFLQRARHHLDEQVSVNTYQDMYAWTFAAIKISRYVLLIKTNFNMRKYPGTLVLKDALIFSE